MNDANKVAIPMDVGQNKVTVKDADKLTERTPFREAIGCLMYLDLLTRPDIMYAVNQVSQHTENPSKKVWNDVKRILI